MILDLQLDVNQTISGHASPLYIASESGNYDLVEFFLSLPFIDVNKGYMMIQYTPLMIAAEEGEVQIVKLLLADKNINVHFKNRYDDTAFSVAENFDNQDVLELLNDWLNSFI